jgi:hypothetical protein
VVFAKDYCLAGMSMPSVPVATNRFDQYHDMLREEVREYLDSVAKEY